MEPPVAARRPVTTTHHGRTRVDEYEWLRASDDPDVTAYLEAENAYAQERVAHLAELRESIFEEIKARTRETDLSVPTRSRGYWYYARSFEGKEYGATCRVPIRGDDDWTPPQPDEDCVPDQPALPGEHLLLDVNELAEGHEFFALGGSSVSPDTHLLAYSTDTTGDERFTVRVKDLRTGQLLPTTRSPACSAGPPGAATAATSTTRPSTSRGGPTRSGGTASAPASPTTSWSTTSRTGGSGSGWAAAALTGSSSSPLASKTTSEYRYLDADDPDEGFRVFSPRRDGLEYGLEHAVIGGEDVFLVLHNHTGPDFELAIAPIAPTAPEGWRPLIPHDPAVRLEDVDAYAGHLVVNQRSDGLTQLRILELGRRRRPRRLPDRVRPGDLHGRLGQQPGFRHPRRAAGLHHA